MACTMLLGGAACAACAFVPAGGAQIALASIGKFGIAGARGPATSLPPKQAETASLHFM